MMKIVNNSTVMLNNRFKNINALDMSEYINSYKDCRGIVETDPKLQEEYTDTEVVWVRWMPSQLRYLHNIHDLIVCL